MKEIQIILSEDRGRGALARTEVGEDGESRKERKMHMRTPHKPTSTYKTTVLHPQL